MPVVSMNPTRFLAVAALATLPFLAACSKPADAQGGPPPAMPVFVGHGRLDRFAQGMAKVAACFPPASRHVVEGDHDCRGRRGILRGGERVFEAAELPLPGAHNARNLCAALAAIEAPEGLPAGLALLCGPPGSGKTTALVNSEIKFPLSGQQGGLQGFGGTRYCDWWFAEDAILIDTAGRYTTQDSDAGADSASWSSFLNLLKKNRPKQPINGVILAISVADLMNAGPEKIASHAETVRARLGEIHETLKVDFPVYVMFTKADEMDAQLVGQNRLVDHVTQDLIHGFQLPVCAKADVPECG